MFSRCFRVGRVCCFSWCCGKKKEKKIAFVDLVSQLRLKQDFSRALAQLLFQQLLSRLLRTHELLLVGGGSDGLHFLSSYLQLLSHCFHVCFCYGVPGETNHSCSSTRGHVNRAADLVPPSRHGREIDLLTEVFSTNRACWHAPCFFFFLVLKPSAGHKETQCIVSCWMLTFFFTSKC